MTANRRRLVIAIDCDDVLLNATEFIVDTYNRLYDTKVQLVNAHTSKSNEWGAERGEVLRRIFDIQHSSEYKAIKPRKDAINSLARLAKEHELHLVTARPTEISDVTEAMIEQCFEGCFTEVNHVGLDASKGEVCERIHADIMIDDNIRHLVDAYEHGVRTLVWFGDYPWHESQRVQATLLVVYKCLDWADVEKVVADVSKR